MTSNLIYVLLILGILTIAGWVLKAIVATIQGKPINTNLANPLNLKARWPKENKDKEGPS